MSDIILQTKNLTVKYGNLTALSGVNLEVEKGDFIGIIGPNGGGKSTFIKAVLSLVPYSGKIYTPTGTRLGYVPQHSGIDRSFPVTVWETVLLARVKKGFSPFFKFSNKDKDAARAALEQTGLKGFEKRALSMLSGGEFQKLLIARALAKQPDLLLLDEPTANVDPKSRESIYKLFKELAPEVTVIMVTHDIYAAQNRFDKAAYLNTELSYFGSCGGDILSKLSGGAFASASGQGFI